MTDGLTDYSPLPYEHLMRNVAKLSAHELEAESQLVERFQPSSEGVILAFPTIRIEFEVSLVPEITMHKLETSPRTCGGCGTLVAALPEVSIMCCTGCRLSPPVTISSLTHSVVGIH